MPILPVFSENNTSTKERADLPAYHAHNSPTSLSNTRHLTLQPLETYGPPRPSPLRLGNGGAGPTGLLRALALDYQLSDSQAPTISWYRNISPLTLQALGTGDIDVALTYERDQEADAIARGSVRGEPVLVFNDHFVLCGPVRNPAGVETGDSPKIAFGKVARYAESEPGRQVFFSRDDGSATNQKELEIWRMAGVAANADWRVCATVFPADALRRADEEGLYVLSDHGTFNMLRRELRETEIFVTGGDLLRNQCYALVSAHSDSEAARFVDYMTSSRGQGVIGRFGIEEYGGHPLFTKAAQLDFPSRG